MDNAIELKKISKKYVLTNERPVLLKRLFLSQKKQEKWALKNISLTIKKGECVGIIGENGSGKSTLLKIISGITSPTEGSIKVNGRVCSIIELGAGFHPDLTGKENVYLNATLLGLTKKEIDNKYNEIVEFADIGHFISQPVRTYSSGMTMRLGFSVAIHLDPEILLIDEVLAVGDEEFQRKSINNLHRLISEKKTIIFVSHDLNIVENICNSVLLIKNGRIIFLGAPKKAIETFFREIKKNKFSKTENRSFKNNKVLKFSSINFLGIRNLNNDYFSSNDAIKIVLSYQNTLMVKKAVFGIAIYNINDQRLYGTSSSVVNLTSRSGKIIFMIKKSPVLNSSLYFTFAISSPDYLIKYDWIEKEYIIKLRDEKKENYLNFDAEWKLYD